MKSKILVIEVVIIAALILVGVYFFFNPIYRSSAPIPASQSLGDEISNQVQDPAEKLPETNPFNQAKTNPYEDSYKNPFE